MEVVVLEAGTAAELEVAINAAIAEIGEGFVLKSIEYSVAVTSVITKTLRVYSALLLIDEAEVVNGG